MNYYRRNNASQASRRNFVLLGALGLSSLAVPRQVFANAARKTKAKNVLVIFEQGGMSQVDTWDPKPNAPVEHRSPFKPIQTNVPGVFVTELLQETSRHFDKLSLVRCMTQPTPGVGNSHPKGSQYIYSGQPPGGPVEMPDIGSIASHLLGTETTNLPSYIMVPGTNEQAKHTKIGFLPPAHKVFKTGGNLADRSWEVPNLGLLGIDEKQFNSRRDLLKTLDVGIVGASKAKDALAMKSLMQQATDMLTNPATRKAFDLSSEPDKVHQMYGTGHRGQCYLLGRKLIEAGVRFVTVDVRESKESFRDGQPVTFIGANNLNWDHHDAIYSTTHTNDVKEGGGAGFGRYGIATWPMMGSLDQALSGLLEDMHQRGLLEETLVCFVSEFGRTPKISQFRGRDHWTHAFTFAFAGAGVPPGQVIGSTDDDGGYITSSEAYTIEDYAATVLEKLGIDRSEPLYTPDDRPIFLVKEGKPIPGLF